MHFPVLFLAFMAALGGVVFLILFIVAVALGFFKHMGYRHPPRLK